MMYTKVRRTNIQLSNFRGYRFLEYRKDSKKKYISSFTFYHRKIDIITFPLKDHINIYLPLNKYRYGYMFPFKLICAISSYDKANN